MSDRSSSTPECGAAEPALPIERSSSGSAPFCSPEHRTDARPPGRPLPEAAEGNLRCCSTPGCTSHQLHPAAHSAFSPPSPMDAAATAALWAKISGTGGSSSSKAKQLAFGAQNPKSDKAVSAGRPHPLSRDSSSSSATPGLLSGQQSGQGGCASARLPGSRGPPVSRGALDESVQNLDPILSLCSPAAHPPQHVPVSQQPVSQQPVSQQSVSQQSLSQPSVQQQLILLQQQVQRDRKKLAEAQINNSPTLLV